MEGRIVVCLWLATGVDSQWNGTYTSGYMSTWLVSPSECCTPSCCSILYSGTQNYIQVIGMVSECCLAGFGERAIIMVRGKAPSIRAIFMGRGKAPTVT